MMSPFAVNTGGRLQAHECHTPDRDKHIQYDFCHTINTCTVCNRYLQGFSQPGHIFPSKVFVKFCFQILLSSLIIQICTCVLNFHTFMLVRQAFLKFMLLLQLTMLMDELRITSTAERSFSWSLRVTHSRKAQAISLRYVTHILKHFHSDSWCAHVCQTALAWCLWFWAFSEFFSSVWNAVVTARLLLFRISSKWCSISASVAETELQTL